MASNAASPISARSFASMADFVVTVWSPRERACGSIPGIAFRFI
jgi:hypothetical protein